MVLIILACNSKYVLDLVYYTNYTEDSRSKVFINYIWHNLVNICVYNLYFRGLNVVRDSPLKTYGKRKKNAVLFSDSSDEENTFDK